MPPQSRATGKASRRKSERRRGLSTTRNSAGLNVAAEKVCQHSQAASQIPLYETCNQPGPLLNRVYDAPHRHRMEGICSVQ